MKRRIADLQPSLVVYALAALAVSAVFFLLPMALIFSHAGSADQGMLQGLWKILQSSLVLRVFTTTVEISVTAGVMSVVLGYPVALHIFRQSARWKIVCFTLVLMPFWTSILVKSYAFMIILGDHGIINRLLRTGLGLHYDMLFNRFAVIVGMTNFLVPYAIFPILASLAAQNLSIQKAAEVMGATRWKIFWRITFVQSLPGVLAALLMCLVISMGFFVTPALLGGRKDMMMANIIDLYTREILDWQSASLIALLLLVFCACVSGLILKLQSRAGV
jgi:ABC-type spermidine/putrescine transport system permease subunit I